MADDRLDSSGDRQDRARSEPHAPDGVPLDLFWALVDPDRSNA